MDGQKLTQELSNSLMSTMVPFMRICTGFTKKKIPFETDCDPDGHHCSALYDHEANETLIEPVELWLLADRLMTAKLRNAAADAILRVLKLIHPKSDMEDVFHASMINGKSSKLGITTKSTSRILAALSMVQLRLISKTSLEL